MAATKAAIAAAAMAARAAWTDIASGQRLYSYVIS